MEILSLPFGIVGPGIIFGPTLVDLSSSPNDEIVNGGTLPRCITVVFNFQNIIWHLKMTIHMKRTKQIADVVAQRTDHLISIHRVCKNIITFRDAVSKKKMLY